MSKSKRINNRIERIENRFRKKIAKGKKGTDTDIELHERRIKDLKDKIDNNSPLNLSLSMRSDNWIKQKINVLERMPGANSNFLGNAIHRQLQKYRDVLAERAAKKGDVTGGGNASLEQHLREDHGKSSVADTGVAEPFEGANTSAALQGAQEATGIGSGITPMMNVDQQAAFADSTLNPAATNKYKPNFAQPQAIGGASMFGRFQSGSFDRIMGKNKKK